MDMKLQQVQVLKPQLTQELRQAITLLGYHSAELAEYIDELSLENPLIERKETDTPPLSYHKTNKNRMNAQEAGLQLSDPQKTLQDVLKQQALDMNLTNTEKKIFHYLIHSLDSNGYLEEDMEEAARRLSVSAKEAEAVLAKLQSLEPAGIGARSLRECILLQLQRLPNRNEQAEMLVSAHFEAFAQKNWKALSKMTGIPLHTIQDISDDIAALHPRPGLLFARPEQDMYIEPDIFIIVKNGHIAAELNTRSFPEIELQSQYRPLLSSGSCQDTASYLSAKYQEWRWLDRALRQRKQTITRIVSELITRQREFFLKGRSAMKPLTLREVADCLSLHESTVSRAIKGKTLQTPYGLFEMKLFFSAKAEASGDGDASNYAVKTHLEDLINQEDKTKPLSDQKLADLLNEQHGIQISRRTVAKYRDQLNIPSSAARKRYK
ncbi:RNA polymerase factor sigma-54 [Bacillus vallismortis]|uniref:RNA polymerase factor sigma-54 n=1 Tax=Bacillus vallismortis TaxID=72361 RepID=UPI0002894358|nr:RNA polymerase factor sigma-54 [Bacillus vallismortis]MBG9770335.1 RNA polymerase sigma54 factor [Bacillus vallismortis]MCY8545913.1 RNA polymerase factor sigma-54 [Bacillus vallismortis]MEC1267614.1 RNA polymerase factor sigma-54 [Bacillus vallismortis]QAV07140.1 RNA polymerase sigma-54 factor [Bacillus vallismortis]QAV11105.1 RNA polymerase sigma-54 factor [Bacillus vallismortis]